MTSSTAINELATALSKAQAEFPAIGKDKTAKIRSKSGAEYSYDYADLATCFDAVRPALAKYELAILQPVAMNGEVVVTTVLAHSSGQWVSGDLAMPVADKSDPRAVASAITYARRYGLLALLGVAPSEEDDDGATAAVKPQGYTMENPAPERHGLVAGTNWPPTATSPVPAFPAGPAKVDGQLYVRKVQSKPTKKAGITKYEVMLSTGEMVSTIKERLAGLAEEACRDNRPVTVSTKASPYGIDLIELHYADKAPKVDTDTSRFRTADEALGIMDEPPF